MVAARASAVCASMSARRMWMSAMRCGSVAVSASAISARALGIGGHHRFEHARFGRRRFLRHAADAGPAVDLDRAGVERHAGPGSA